MRDLSLQMSKGRWDTTAWGNGPDDGASGEFTAGEAKTESPPKILVFLSELRCALRIVLAAQYLRVVLPSTTMICRPLARITLASLDSVL